MMIADSHDFDLEAVVFLVVDGKISSLFPVDDGKISSLWPVDDGKILSLCEALNEFLF